MRLHRVAVVSTPGGARRLGAQPWEGVGPPVCFLCIVTPSKRGSFTVGLICALEPINELSIRQAPETNQSACRCKLLWLLNDCRLKPAPSAVKQPPVDRDEV